MNSEWSRADVIGAWTLGATVAGVFAAWLAVPGLREWIARLRIQSDPIEIGDLSGATPQRREDPSLPPGVVRADTQTLKALLDATSSVAWEWLKTQDFGEPFPKSLAEKVGEYAFQHTDPRNEFLDAELERLRSAFNAASSDFVSLTRRSTPIFPPKPDVFELYIPTTRRTTLQDWQQERGVRAREVNVAAKMVLDIYEVLVRRARAKLAVGTSKPEKAA